MYALWLQSRSRARSSSETSAPLSNAFATMCLASEGRRLVIRCFSFGAAEPLELDDFSLKQLLGPSVARMGCSTCKHSCRSTPTLASLALTLSSGADIATASRRQNASRNVLIIYKPSEDHWAQTCVGGRVGAAGSRLDMTSGIGSGRIQCISSGSSLATFA